MKKSDTSTSLPGFYLEHTAKRMKLAFQRALKSWGTELTADQWVVLYTLQDHGPQSQTMLAKKNAKDAPTMTRIIDLLVQKDIVTREQDPRDARRWLIHLTEKGQEQFRQILPKAEAFRSACYKGLQADEITALQKSLETITKNITS